MPLTTARPTATWLAPILDALDPEQRGAATLPNGPAQIIAPAGSGKTTTLVARLSVLLARGVPPERICVVTFNRDAALDLAGRIAKRLAPAVPDANAIEVRTLHALARQVLVDAGERAEIVADRLPLLRAARRRCEVGRHPRASPMPDPSTLDTELSAWKVEGRAPPDESREVLDAFAAMLAGRNAVDFDDLVVGAVAGLKADPELRSRWQARFSHLCVDEFQDVDAAQLRLVRLLAAPEDNLFVVGDDDQTIYAWRLADVRRILAFGDDYPAARRVMLATNYRCPEPVVEASARLIETNRERFAKPIRAGALAAPGAVISAVRTDRPGWAESLARLAASHDAERRTCCFLSRTRSELMPVQLALIRAGTRHATALPGPAEAEPVRRLVDALRRRPDAPVPFHALLELRGTLGWRRGDPAGDALGDDDHAALDAALGWAVAFPTASAYLAAYDAAVARLAALRDLDAPVELATIHGSKGREWQTVIIVGFEEDRFPNHRALAGAADPDRALEEERRLAYVALTRATGRLILAFDPTKPSRFLAEMGFVSDGLRP